VYEEICVEFLGPRHVKSECGLPSNDDIKTKCEQERTFSVILIYLTILYQLGVLYSRIFQNGKTSSLSGRFQNVIRKFATETEENQAHR